MKIIQSIIVLVLLVFLVFASVKCIIATIKHCKQKSKKPIVHFRTIVCVTITMLNIVFIGDYIYPFERPLMPVLIAEFDVPKAYELDYPGEKFWHGAYEAYGIYGESLYFDTDNRQSLYGFGWPPMDFKTYNYIITYGQEIESLSYNVWDVIDTPIRTGAKAGHMVLAEEFSPSKVYVYRIPKIRIDNDI